MVCTAAEEEGTWPTLSDPSKALEDTITFPVLGNTLMAFVELVETPEAPRVTVLTAPGGAAQLPLP